MAWLGEAEGTVETSLRSGWQLALSESPLPPGEAGFEALAAAPLRWVEGQVPGTAASALRRAGLWTQGAPLDFDAQEVWLRTRFEAAPGPEGSRHLAFDGLATLCEVQLNGARLLGSQSMFLRHVVDVSRLLRGDNELVLRFGPLAAALQQKRPRPHWKTGLVRNQQLRWIRTTLLGRMPSWPLPAPVGAHRSIRLIRSERLAVLRSSVRPLLGADGVGRAGVSLRVRPLQDSSRLTSARLEVAGASAPLSIRPDGDELILAGCLELPGVQPWWPSTHGEPKLHAASVTLQLGADTLRIALPRLGFRRVEADRSAGGFSLRLNGEKLFCRGAVHFPADADALGSTREELRAQLETLRRAGLNCLRVAGPTLYEDRDFYELCDELGLLVFQDFMFANLDYPDGDEGFCAAVRAEVQQVLEDREAHPSLAVLCGGSEGHQQPSLLGMTKEAWQRPLYDELLPQLCAEHAPGVPYVANCPSGGQPPHRVDVGIANYFGVGAYLRPLSDARESGVRFAGECLAFANVPSRDFLDRRMPGVPPVANPSWKAGVPRDASAAWDFDDVRDHYLGLLFGVDPTRLRWTDPERYLSLARAASGEAMEAAFTSWRTADTCAGGIVLSARDLRPGAGFGLLDSDGGTKPALWMLSRALGPRAVLLTSEGLNGVGVHLINESASPLAGRLELLVFRGEQVVGRSETEVSVPARGAIHQLAEELLGRFFDAGAAYLFGPPQHDAIAATLWPGRPGEGEFVSQAVKFIGPAGAAREPSLACRVVRDGGGAWLSLTAASVARSVELVLEAPWAPLESFVHVVPGAARRVGLEQRGEPAEGRVRGEAVPLVGRSVRFTE